MGAKTAILLFPVVGRCRNHLPTLFEHAMVVNPKFAAGSSIMSVVVTEINISGFVSHVTISSSLGLLVTVPIAWDTFHEFAVTWSKAQNFLWNFDTIYHISKDSTISGLAVKLLFTVVRQCRIYLQTLSLSFCARIVLGRSLFD